LKLFSRNKESKDPADIIANCLTVVVNRITDSLSEDTYRWSKPWGVVRFESMILAKFLMDYSFNGLVDGKLKDDEKVSFASLCQTSFSKLFNDEFSAVGLNYEDMQEEISAKIEGYHDARRSGRPPKCWHEIYTLITRSKTREELEEELKKKMAGLELIRDNQAFAGMVPQYEAQIKVLADRAEAFESAEMMLPHMVRFTKEKLRALNLKKMKALSKKMSKKDKGKDKKKKK